MTQPLITRLSKLTGPRYTMDVAIALATDFWPKDRIQNIVYNEDGDPWVYFTDGPDLPLPPAYTASVDAAIALAEKVLPGWNGDLDIGKPIADSGKMGCRIWTTESKYHNYVGEGFNSATALLIALLRAKEASTL